MIIIYCFKDYYKYFEDYVNSLLAHIPKKKKIVKYTCPDKHFKKKFASKIIQKYLTKDKHIFMQGIPLNVFNWFDVTNFNFLNKSDIYVINTEQISRASYTIGYKKYILSKDNWFFNINKYKISVIDYSLENIECYYRDNLLSNHISVYYIPYQINNSEIFNYDKIKDVAMVSNNSSRRWSIYHKMRSMNIKVDNIIGWLRERDNRLFRYKILVNIHHKKDFKIMEQFRINRCIFNNIIVITEDSTYSNKLILKNYMIICKYEDIIDMVIKVLNNYEHYYSKLFNNINIEKLDRLFKRDFKKLFNDKKN